ncbi:MAG: hypothetical protein NT166_18425 [Candidatus Aminicenantes bacterium]|nr:hypothetical protein [Candidatus Aminicenantes bacterium]
MLEKIKQFITGIVSVSIVFYVIGYITEYAQAKMLGMPMINMVSENYFISCGTFFLSTLFALYSTLFSHWYYYIIFLCAAGAFFYFDRYEQKKNLPSLQVAYTALLVIIIVVYLVVVIPIFYTPFRFDDFLQRHFEPITQTGFFAGIEKALRTWILNENSTNILKLNAFYGLLILTTALCAVMTYILARRWQKDRSPITIRAVQNRLSMKTQGKEFKPWHDYLRRALPVIIGIMAIITIILLITIPIDFGVLIKSNTIPEVKISVVDGVELMPDREPGMESKLWLLRENRDEILLHAIYVEKGKTRPVFKILVLKKQYVKTIEIFPKSFIFSIK